LNPTWSKFTGQSLEESLGLGWLAMIHPDDQPRISELWERCALTGETYEGEVRYRRHDGQYRWHFFRGIPVRGADGAITAWHGASLDIQEQKSAEETLREADRRKDEFLATLSHELRNPLAPISMGLEILKSYRSDPGKIEDTRAMMERQTRQLIRLVDDLLDVSRITRGKLELRRSIVKLSDVISSAVEASQVFIAEGGHQLTVSLPEDPLYVDADPNRLAQVVSNLVNNAAKYTPKGGSVHLSAIREGEKVVTLSVADTGVGIPPEMLESIFEMFSQGEGSSRTSTSGLGIGLTLVKSLVQLHGGSIEARSAGPNKGSEFRVRLPIVAPPREPRPAPAPPEEAEIKTNRRVLVVDDNQTAAAMLGMVVTMLGNEVRTAHDGQQAIDIAAEYLPEIVFMDLGMPNVDGYEAAREIRKQAWGKTTLLVALTGWGQEEHKRQTKEAGFDHHLVKPGEFADLQRLFAELEKKQG
jgi:PAS domain S-box-containing protein